jgi:REP element-mobilizing transposase RayT
VRWPGAVAEDSPVIANSRPFLYLSFMAVEKPIEGAGIYFITFTSHNWLPLIGKAQCYAAFYKWFDILKKRGHSLTGYVLMPNHVHLLLHYSGGNRSLNLEVGSGKRFIADEIIKKLQLQKEEALLYTLSKAVRPKEKSRGKLHEVWEDSFDWKQCRTEKFILQKLIYIHNNPCSGKWQLAEDSIHYLHSSARFYFNGEPCAYPVEDYREFLALIQTE